MLGKAQVAIAGFMVVLVMVAVFVAQPDWLGVLGASSPARSSTSRSCSTSTPRSPRSPVWVELAVFLGGVGGGMYDYIGYTGMLREKSWGMLGHAEIDAIERPAGHQRRPRGAPDRHRRRGPGQRQGWSRAPLIDMMAAFVALLVIGAAFIINGATILGAEQKVPSGRHVLSYQSEFLGVISPVFEYFYIVAIVMVLVRHDLRRVGGLLLDDLREPVRASQRRSAGAGQRRDAAGRLRLDAGRGDRDAPHRCRLRQLITPASIVGGIFACGIYGLGLLVLERRSFPAALRTSRPHACSSPCRRSCCSAPGSSRSVSTSGCCGDGPSRRGVLLPRAGRAACGGGVVGVGRGVHPRRARAGPARDETGRRPVAGRPGRRVGRGRRRRGGCSRCRRAS